MLILFSQISRVHGLLFLLSTLGCAVAIVNVFFSYFSSFQFLSHICSTLIEQCPRFFKIFYHCYASHYFSDGFFLCCWVENSSEVVKILRIIGHKCLAYAEGATELSWIIVLKEIKELWDIVEVHFVLIVLKLQLKFWRISKVRNSCSWLTLTTLPRRTTWQRRRIFTEK